MGCYDDESVIGLTNVGECGQSSLRSLLEAFATYGAVVLIGKRASKIIDDILDFLA